MKTDSKSIKDMIFMPVLHAKCFHVTMATVAPPDRLSICQRHCMATLYFLKNKIHSIKKRKKPWLRVTRHFCKKEGLRDKRTGRNLAVGIHFTPT